MEAAQLNWITSFIWVITDRVHTLITEQIPTRMAAEGRCVGLS